MTNLKVKMPKDAVRQWLDGDLKIRPKDASAEECFRFVTGALGVTLVRLKTLRPWIKSMHEHYQKSEEPIGDCANWTEFRRKYLGAWKKRAINYMLAGGNQDAKKKKEHDATEDLGDTISPRQKIVSAWQGVETVMEILERSNRILAMPITAELAVELKELIASAIQSLTEAMDRMRLIIDTD